MTDIVIFILAILIASQVAMSLWNSHSFKELKKRSSLPNNQLNDSKYYELKSKHEFTLAVVSIVTTGIVVLGYNSIQNLQDRIKADYEKKVEVVNAKLDSTEKKSNELLTGIPETFMQIDSSLRNSEKMLSYLRNEQVDVSAKTAKTKSDITSAQQRIREINSKNILKQNLYIVKRVPFDMDHMPEGGMKRIYFKDLRTVMGDKLPQFLTSPFCYECCN